MVGMLNHHRKFLLVSCVKCFDVLRSLLRYRPPDIPSFTVSITSKMGPNCGKPDLQKPISEGISSMKTAGNCGKPDLQKPISK